jgi:integrase
MGSLYKRNGFWYIGYYQSGRRIRKKISSSKRVAQIALADAMLAAERKSTSMPAGDDSIGKFCERYEDYSRTNHSPSTAQRYREVMAHFREFLNVRYARARMLADITPAMMEDFKAYRKDACTTRGRVKGRSVHPKTINLELGTLKAMFNLAMKWGYMDANPAKGVKPLRVIERKTPRFLTKDELAILLKNAPPDFRPVVEVLAHTGMRKGELANLQWRDDFDREVVHVRAKEDWTPKTSEREIPMSPIVKDVLLRLRGGRKAKSALVFTTKNGAPLNKLRERFMRLTKRCGMQDVTKLHTLRHTFASHLVMAGVALPAVQKLMGHSDIQTTMIYAHLTQEHLRDAVRKLPFES